MTEQATIEWLRAQLDAKEVELMQCRQKNEALLMAIEGRDDLIDGLNAVILKMGSSR